MNNIGVASTYIYIYIFAITHRSFNRTGQKRSTINYSCMLIDPPVDIYRCVIQIKIYTFIELNIARYLDLVYKNIDEP